LPRLEVLEPVLLRLDVHRDVVSARDGGFLLPFLVAAACSCSGELTANVT
jgi:hypothetical protein